MNGCMKISVLIPCYNAEATILRCINSVLDQTQPVFEVLIYDDGSSDNTVAYIRNEYGSNNLVHIFESATNNGAGFGRDFLLKKIKGNVIAFLDADDVWYPEKLEYQIQAMQLQKLDIVTASYHLKRASQKIAKTRKPPRKVSSWSFYFGNPLPMSMTIIRSNLINAKNMPHIRQRQDYAYWYQLFLNNKGIRYGAVELPLGCYEIRDNSISSNKYKNIIDPSNFFLRARHEDHAICLQAFVLSGF